VLATIFIPNAYGILHTAYATNPKDVMFAFLFGVLWGVGGITFGLAIRYLGIALGYAIALGLRASSEPWSRPSTTARS
jgi:L-rhamnose-H+ transport protein